MIEIKFTGYADVVRNEMMQLLGLAPAMELSYERVKPEIQEVQEVGDTPPAPPPAVETAQPKSKAKAAKAKEPPVAAPLDPAATASDPAPTEPSVDASAEPSPAPAVESQQVTEPTAAPATEKEHTWDEVRAAIEAFGKARGPKPLIEFVRSFDVQRASQIPKEKYGEVLARLAAAA